MSQQSPGSQAPPPPPPPPGAPAASSQLRPLTTGEQVVLAAYQEAMKGAVEATNRAAEVLTTVAIAAITAYGALVTLIQPKAAPAPVLAGLPFVIFAAAVVVAVWSRLIGVPITTESNLDNIQKTLGDKVARKRRLAIFALIIVAAGIVFSGFLITSIYPAGTTAPPAPSPD